MKKPAVVIQFRDGLVSSVKAVADSSQVPSTGASVQSLEDQTHEVGGGSAEGQRRNTARTKQPTLPLHPSQLPPSEEDSVDACLAILETPGKPVARYLQHDEEIPGIRIPKRSPKDSSFIAMVEWALRPGDSRVEAYFIGTNKRGKYWFLIQRTVDDLEPYTTRYLSTKTIAMVEKGRLEIEEAAVLLLECAWQFEKDMWEMPCFDMVTDDGLLDVGSVWEVAERVWPEEDHDESDN